MPKKRKPVINAKRAKLLKEIQKQARQGRTPNISEAGRNAGFACPQAAHQSLKRAGIDITAMLEKAGLGVETIFKGFKESEQATETKFFAHNGIVFDTREVIAHDIRLRARTEVARLHNLYPQRDNGSVNAPTANQVFNINVGFLDTGRAVEVFENAGKRSGIDDRGLLGVDENRDQNEG
jgi:hypothetical protein